MNANAAFTETSAKGDALLGRGDGQPGSSLHDRVAAWVNEGGAGGDDESAEASPKSAPSIGSLKLPDYEPRRTANAGSC
jgi:hypothetical protein